MSDLEKAFSVTVEQRGWLWWRRYWVVIWRGDGAKSVGGYNGPYSYRRAAEITADYNRRMYRDLGWREVK